jgi:hypothetical protein
MPFSLITLPLLPTNSQASNHLLLQSRHCFHPQQPKHMPESVILPVPPAVLSALLLLLRAAAGPPLSLPLLLP